ncbi:MAG: Rv2175c family DNA-binding protein [Micrococcales bacterium]|nr:Rv2175c family DNA-binding protein [Micrococcales bacterium]
MNYGGGEENMRVDELVGEWLTVPDVAERLELPLNKVRRLLEERRLLGLRLGEPPVLRIPAAFLVPGALADPAQRHESADTPRWTVLTALPGTLTVLADVGFDDEAALVWLFSPQESLGCSPMAALLAGRTSHVRRVAQAEL